MDATGKDPVDTLCDLLLEEDLSPERGHHRAAHRRHPALPAALDRDGRDGLRRSLVQSQALGPTAALPRILGQFVRDEALLSLEEAIRRG